MLDTRRSLARHALLVGLAFVLAWAWLSLRADAPLHEDTSRDLAFARDLVDARVLHRHGAWASFASLEQGTSFVDLLALCRLAGLGFVGIGHVMTTLLAACVALLVWGVLELLPDRLDAPARERGAIVAGVALLAMLPVVAELPVLWQPTLLPLPLVLAHLALWRLLRDGSPLDALALAIACALAIDVHVVSVAFVPLALLALALASRWPSLTSSLAAAAGVALLALSSWDAWVDDLARLDARGWLLAPLVLLACVWVAGLLLRARFARRDWPTRLRLALLAEGTLLLALVLASLSDATPSLAGRYFAPFVPALAMALALASCEANTPLLRRAPAWLALVGLVLASATLRSDRGRVLPQHPAWTLAEFEPLAAALHARGLTWTELVTRLQGPDAAAQLGMLASVLEPGSDAPEGPTQGLLVVALTSEQLDSLRDELPAAAQVLALADDLHSLVLDTSARVDRLGAQLCREGHDCTPVVLALTDRIAQSHLTAWIDLGPGVVGSDRHRTAGEWLADAGEPREVQWRLPIRRGEAATLVLASLQPERCAWSFVDVEGFATEVELPARELELEAAAEGSVLVARRLDPHERACAEHGLLPPAIVELRPQWRRLHALLATRP